VLTLRLLTPPLLTRPAPARPLLIQPVLTRAVRTPGATLAAHMVILTVRITRQHVQEGSRSGPPRAGIADARERS